MKNIDLYFHESYNTSRKLRREKVRCIRIRESFRQVKGNVKCSGKHISELYF